MFRRKQIWLGCLLKYIVLIILYLYVVDVESLIWTLVVGLRLMKPCVIWLFIGRCVMCEYRHMYIPATRCKPVCAGLYDFVMSHYADAVRCMRCSCGCTVSADMEKGDNMV
nr:MAG TPA: hypothetical protein [Bacteriophage sp.]